MAKYLSSSQHICKLTPHLSDVMEHHLLSLIWLAWYVTHALENKHTTFIYIGMFHMALHGLSPWDQSQYHQLVRACHWIIHDMCMAFTHESLDLSRDS